MKSKKPLIILGFQNYANHDSGACLFRIDESNEEIRYVAISEERLNRKKYSYFFPAHSIKYCMDALGIESVKEIDMVVGDWARIKRWHNSGPAYRKAEFDYIKLKLNIPPEKFYQVPYHHDAHAASAFYPSGFKEAAILPVEGTGSDLRARNIYYERTEGHGTGVGLPGIGEKNKRKIVMFEPQYDLIQTDYAQQFSLVPYVTL